MSLMDDTNRRRGLGRGLSALLGGPVTVAAPSVMPPPAGAVAPMMASPRPESRAAGEEPARQDAEIPALPDQDRVVALPIERLHPGRYQPRRLFDPQAIADLVESIRVKGILQPILLRPHPDYDGHYEIIAGERRWRAAQAAGLHLVPCIVRRFADIEAMEIGLIENLQRQDLSPLEEAEGYRRLLDEFNHTQEELGRVVGKSRSHIANMVRLLALPDPVRQLLDARELSAGHARALLTSPDPLALARQVIHKGLNVRQTEKLAQKALKAPAGGSEPTVDPDRLALEQQLADILGLRVRLRGNHSGDLNIRYDNLDQLDQLLYLLTGGLLGRIEQPDPELEDLQESDEDLEQGDLLPTDLVEELDEESAAEDVSRSLLPEETDQNSLI